MAWDGVDRRSVDYGERVATLEANARHTDELIEKLVLQVERQEEVLSEIKGAIRFIKLIAWIATIGMSAWGIILAKIEFLSGNK